MSKIGALVAKEVREAAPPAILFLFLFHLIALTRDVSVGNYSITALRATAATVGALLVAKAILVVEALPITRRSSKRRFVRVLWKTLLFGAMVLLFKFLEEIIPLAVKHGGVVVGTRMMFLDFSWPLFCVVGLWVLGALFFYCFVSELVGAVGHEKVKAMFFGTDGEESGGVRSAHAE